jgi:glycosyltransferase involved in cell wall biosynthesis
MKILHIITRFNAGGTATWLNQLADGETFAEDQMILAFGTCSKNEFEATPHSKYKQVRVSNLKREINPLRDLAALIQLTSVIRKIRPDIVNTHTFKAGLIGRLACFLSGKKQVRVIHTVHGHLIYGYFNSWVTKSILILEKIWESLTDGFIVAGNVLLKELKSKGLLNKGNVAVILPGFRSDNLDVSRSETSEIKIGWIGRLEQIKRPDRLIEIARLLPDLEFFMAGSGELEGQLLKNLPANVHLVGWVSPTLFWSDKSIGLLTSDNEATPYAIIEGNRVGVPFVATNVGSVADVVLNEVNGFLCGKDAELLASKVRLLANNSRLRKTLGENARKMSTEKFSTERFQGEHREFYSLFTS